MANHAPSTEHPLALPAAALTAIVLGIALARARCVRERRACARDAARDAECIELSDSEVANAQRVGSLSTVNVYRGELGGPALAHLKASVQATLDANPWLAGRLAPSERSGAAVALYVPRGASASDVFVEAKAPQLTVDLPYHQLCELTGCHAVDRGVQAGPLGRTRGSVFKVTVLRGEGGARVGCTALCVSMSHTIADAYTFYKIYRMLAGTEPVASLDVVRRPHRLPRGHARMAWVQAGPLAAFHLDARLRPGIEISPLALDAEVTRKSKAAHLPTPDVPFVSSTDVHVSQLCRALAPDAAIVKVNPRASVPHIADDTIAGNYNDWLVLRPDEYANAHAVRALLSAHAPPPPLRDDMRGPPRALFESLALVASWRFGPTEAPLPGVEQLVHLPNFAGWPALRRWVCLFTPRQGETAALVHAPNSRAADKVRALPIVAGFLSWHHHEQ